MSRHTSILYLLGAIFEDRITEYELTDIQGMSKEIDKILDKKLGSRQRAMMLGRSGLDTGARRSIKQLASELRISKRTAAQAQDSAISRLRQPEIIARLEKYMELIKVCPALTIAYQVQTNCLKKRCMLFEDVRGWPNDGYCKLGKETMTDPSMLLKGGNR